MKRLAHFILMSSRETRQRLRDRTQVSKTIAPTGPQVPRTHAVVQYFS